MITNSIPRINDDPSDFDRLFGFRQRIESLENPQVRVDFSECDFIRQNAVAFIGGLIRLIRHRGGQATLDTDSIRNEWVRTNLQQNGFLHAFGASGGPWRGNSIPYREDVRLDKDGYTRYLSEDWLGRGWVRIGEQLKPLIVQPVIEAYVNVFDHAESPVGVISCGQHYRNLKELRLTLVDFGVGIPHTVRAFLAQPEMDDQATLRWAFEPGKSTKGKSSLARGMGLKLLRIFIEQNNGKLEIYSGKGYVCISAQGTRFQQRFTEFRGTVVQVALRCDEQYYHLPSEEDYDSGQLWF